MTKNFTVRLIMKDDGSVHVGWTVNKIGIKVARWKADGSEWVGASLRDIEKIEEVLKYGSETTMWIAEPRTKKGVKRGAQKKLIMVDGDSGHEEELLRDGPDWADGFNFHGMFFHGILPDADLVFGPWNKCLN